MASSEYRLAAGMRRRRPRLRHLLPVAIALVATLAFVVLTDGGRAARQSAPAMAYLGSALDTFGLGLNQVTVSGQRMARDQDIYERLRLSGHRSIWLLDTDAARRRVETLPWVARAAIKRVFPDRLHIEIEEREPYAVWSDGERTALIDSAGRILGAPVGKIASALPTVFGPGAPPHAHALIEAIEKFPELRAAVAVYQWTANRRWTLHLKSGRQILLPEAGQNLALEQVVKGRPGSRLLDADFLVLDLRIASQAAMEFRARPSTAVAALRAQTPE